MEYIPSQPDPNSLISQPPVDGEQKRITQRTEYYSSAQIHETLDEQLNRLRKEHPTR